MALTSERPLLVGVVPIGLQVRVEVNEVTLPLAAPPLDSPGGEGHALRGGLVGGPEEVSLQTKLFH